MKVMITGDKGFIGSYVKKRFDSSGFETLSYDIVDGFDITDSIQVNEYVSSNRPDYIVHLACRPILSECNKNPMNALKTIVEGTCNLLESARENTIKRFVYISSSMVYGDFEKIPITENDSKLPKDIYGACKLSAEHLVRTYTLRYGVEHSIVRPSAVYGPGDKGNRVSQIFVENALNKKPLTMNDGKNTMLDFTWVEDVAEGIYLTTTHCDAMNETFNITAGYGRSISEYANLVSKYIPETIIVDSSIDSNIPKRGTLSIGKAIAYLGYLPKNQIEDGIPKYINHLKSSK